mgnify:CR=1 FL=1
MTDGRMQSQGTGAGMGISPPSWVPDAALRYLAHTETGRPIRELARNAGCHASTILRQIRKVEMRRDDLLVDHALRRLGFAHFNHADHTRSKETPSMNAQTMLPSAPNEETLKKEARRILRRLSEKGAVLAVAEQMDKAVVVKDNGQGDTSPAGVVDRAVAEALALKDWIACANPGRVSRYRITQAGRSALARLLAEAENAARKAANPKGFAEAQTPFSAARAAQSAAPQDEDEDEDRPRRMRYAMGESPLTSLARRRDKDGAPFLTDDLVRAGERFREDFELAQIGENTTQKWEGLLTGGVTGGRASGDPVSGGASAARARVEGVLKDLGPGLGDVALRCCCYLEGLEVTEKRLGWSARSGKIVLRIALQRLKRHYEMLGPGSDLIG